MNKNNQEKKIIKSLKNLLRNKPKGHHDPLFLGNEKKVFK